MSLGENLRELRNKRKLTQEEVATSLGMSRSAYNLIENGKRKPDFYSILKMAELFNTSTDYILGNTRDPRSISELKNLPQGYSEIDLIYDELEKINGGKSITKAQINALLVFIKNYPDYFVSLGNDNSGVSSMPGK